MSSQDALLAHIVARIRADIDFLVSQNVISPSDGRAIDGKLPGHQALTPLPTPVSTPSFPSVAPAVRSGVPPLPLNNSSHTPRARALWAYNVNGTEANDLSFHEGEVIEVLEEVNADWWKGKNTRNQTGLFPSNYVEKVPDVTEPPSTNRMVPPPPIGKLAYDPMANPPSQPPVQQAPIPQDPVPQKKGKFGKFGSTMAHSAAGGVGFGAGAAVGSGIINAIF